MASVTLKSRKQELGIYYTPDVVASFVFEVLNVLKREQDDKLHRWENHQPTPHFPSVIDPAVGEGIFLKAAITSGFTKPFQVFGVDIDEHVVEQWEEINLLRSFGSDADLRNHFFHQNGLMPLDEEKVLRYKKGGLREFDAVVGNPPYGGIGLSETQLTEELIAHLNKYEILRYKGGISHHNGQESLLNFQNIETAKKLKTFPVEILFLERSIQLAKPGGWVSIVLPDGILANSNTDYVRQFVIERAKVLGIVSLPRDTFKRAGTSAKTSIIFIEKYKADATPDQNYKVFLASIERLEKQQFDTVIGAFNSYRKAEGEQKIG